MALAANADTLTLTDGASFTGEVIKFDDNGLQLRVAEGGYTNLPWGRFSQESLQQLAQNPKIKNLVDPFIEPTESQRPPKPEIKVDKVTRMERPANPSVLGGLVKSPLGLFILLVLYAANLYAGFEVAVVRSRPIPQVLGISAVLPVIGPIIFLALPMKLEAPPEEEIAFAPGGTAAAAAQRSPEEIQIAEASWKQPEEEKKLQPQIYARGKFTFNKRFMETKFAGFAGVTPAGDAKTFTMEVKTLQATFTVERLAQIGATDVIFETVQRGQVTVPFGDIQEIRLNPKTS